MREPMPAVSSSTQPSGALIMNRWLSPSITSALRAVVSCAAAAGLGLAVGLAGDAGDAGAAGGIAASTSAPNSAAAARVIAGTKNLRSGRGSALSDDLQAVARGFGKTNEVMDECTSQRMPSLRAFCTTAHSAATSGPGPRPDADLTMY